MEAERKKYTIQYRHPVNPGFLIAIIYAINKIEAKTLFLQQYPGCAIQCILEDNSK